uniref:WD_REPEATS_REGION domain-containing protein n=1 Tax=Rhabditophanes sp. KR3021 TaxID=114890 RepID=A0AC35UH58_9BILA
MFASKPSSTIDPVHNQTQRVCTNFVETKDVGNYLTVSSKYGLTLAYTGHGNVEVAETTFLHQVQAVNFKQVQLFNKTDRITSMQCNSSGDLIAVVSNGSDGGVAHIYSAQTFAPSFNGTPFPFYVVKLGDDRGNEVLDFQWNPEMATVFAATTSDKTLMLVELSTQELGKYDISAKKKINDQPVCISWSPKGKQLIAGDVNGSMAQYKPDLSLVRVLPFPEPGQKYCCIGICWLGTTDFLMAFQEKGTQKTIVSFVILKKNLPPQYVHFGDLCQIKNITHPQTRYTFINIVEWGIVIVSANNGSEVRMLEKVQEVYAEVVETKKMVVEKSKSNGIESLFGLCLDKTSTLKVNGNKESPMLFLLNSDGCIQSYWVFTRNDNRQQINVIAQKVPSTIMNGPVPAGYKKGLTPVRSAFGLSGILEESEPLSAGSGSSASNIVQTKNAEEDKTALLMKAETEKKASATKAEADKNALEIKANAEKKALEIKAEAEKRDALVKAECARHEKEKRIKAEEEEKLRVETEMKKKAHEEVIALERLQKECGNLISEYYQGKNSNLIHIGKQKTKIDNIMENIAFSNEESVTDLMSGLKLMAMSRDKIQSWTLSVTDELDGLRESVKSIQQKIDGVTKNECSIAETYLFDSKERFDLSHKKINSVVKKMNKTVGDITELRKKATLKKAMALNDKLELDENFDQETASKVSVNINRATFKAYRKLKVLHDKIIELKQLKDKKQKDLEGNDTLNSTIFLNNSLTFDKTYLDETLTLDEADMEIGNKIKRFLIKRTSKPLVQTKVNLSKFSDNVVEEVKNIEKDVENSLKSMKQVVEKSLMKSSYISTTIAENSFNQSQFRVDDSNEIRKNVLKEAMTFAAEFQSMLEINRKMMAATMPKTEATPKKEDTPKKENIPSKEDTSKKEKSGNASKVTESVVITPKVVGPTKEILSSKDSIFGQIDAKAIIDKETPKISISGQTNTPAIKLPAFSEASNVEATGNEKELSSNSETGPSTETATLPTSEPVIKPESVVTPQPITEAKIEPVVEVENVSNVDTKTEPVKSFFGGLSSLNQSTPTKSTTVVETPSIFNTPTAPKTFFGDSSSSFVTPKTNTSFFGASNTPQTTTPSVFASQTTAPSIFSNPAPSVQGTSSVFGGSNAFGGPGSTAPSKSVFAESAFGASTKPAFGGSSVFGNSAFGASNKQMSEEGMMDEMGGMTNGFSNAMGGLGSSTTVNKSSVFGGSSSFGGSTAAASSFSFAKPAPPPATNNPFQQSTGFFGGSSNTSNTFGGSTTGSVFGKPAFGNTNTDSTSSFGGPSTPGSTFGKPAFGGSTTPGSTFGKSAFGGSPSVFGASTSGNPQNSNAAFSGFASSGSSFGNIQPTQNSAFGSPSAFGGTQSKPSSFTQFR